MQKQNFNITIQEEKVLSTNKVKVEEPRVLQIEATVAGQFLRKLFQFLFNFHVILITILTVSLTIRGIIFAQKHHFQPKKWYPPLLVSTASAGIVSLAWQWITHSNPVKAIKACFWLGPLMTCAFGILLLQIGSTASFVIGAIAIISAFIQSLYTCWVNHRFEYAGKILSVSTAFPPARTTTLTTLSIVTSILYSSLLVSGIGGATAIGTTLDTLFIVVIILSLAWSMQVIKNVQQVTISRIKYIHFAYGADMDTKVAFRDTIKYLMGSVCIGSVLVPILGVIRGSARTISLIDRDRDEFLFSCANCYSAVASALAMHGNRWGFVHVGVYNKGFIQASFDTWEMFRTVGLEILIDSDLTGAFCFFGGVAGGALSGLVGGTWAFIVHKNYATQVSIYAFLIGYLMTWIAMAWLQACVSAYYVAYAENPHNPRFDSTIPVQIQELQRYQTQQVANSDPVQLWPGEE